MKILLIINEAPYGNEKAYNALRIANQLNKDHLDLEVLIFLMGDGVGCAVSGQTTANGYYNIERMLELSLNKGAKVKICGSCAESRGIKSKLLVEGTEMSNLGELTNWVVTCNQVLTF